jgi:hypothetical protein
LKFYVHVYHHRSINELSTVPHQLGLLGKVIGA